MKVIAKKLRFNTTVYITPFKEQHKLSLTKIGREVGGTTEKKDKYIRVFSLRHLTVLATSLHGNVTSAVKRRLKDAGLRANSGSTD